LQQTSLVTKGRTSGHFEAYQYPAGPDVSTLPMWEGWEEADDDESEESLDTHGNPKETASAGVQAEFEKRLAEESRRSFEAGREKGRQEGRQAEHEAQVGALSTAAQQRIRQAAEMVATFAQERDQFLHTVEREVVELALAVAARILRREAQMDPLLLTGAVRVALGQLSRTTQVRLRVPPSELDLWTEAIALLPNLALKPTIVAGEGMRLGDCVIETELGSVDLGIRSQLGEIERGFFDRAGAAKTETGPAAIGAGETNRETRA
jgi:flagellar biosynthesis/type III secretory pathway protein FliH